MTTAKNPDKPAVKKVGKALPIVVDVASLPVEETALSARWPEPVLLLSELEFFELEIQILVFFQSCKPPSLLLALLFVDQCQQLREFALLLLR